MLTPRIRERYTLLRQLGRGTHGEVWLAEAKADGKRVALKIATGAKAARFAQKEVSILQRLAHPNILPILDAEVEEELAVMVTPFIEGGDLLNYLRARAFIHASLARNIFVQLLSAVEYAHNAGYIHRDIKLENVLFDEKEERIYLIDWCFSGHWTAGKLQVRPS